MFVSRQGYLMSYVCAQESKSILLLDIIPTLVHFHRYKIICPDNYTLKL